MLNNDLNNKLKDVNKLLDGQRNNVETLLSAALKQLEACPNDELRKLCLDLLESAKKGETINHDDFLEKARNYAG